MIAITGPAPAGITDGIFALSQKISEYYTVPDLSVDISALGTQKFTVDDREFVVQVIDTVQDYCEYMKEIFDFGAIKGLLTGAGGKPPLKILANSMHGGKQNSL